MRDITVYKCDVCDREVQLSRKPHGIETVGRCIITQNCRGRLFVEDLILTTAPFIKRTPDVEGVENFYPRTKLVKFTQPFSKTDWFISHKLETFPIISVYADDDDQTPISKSDYTVNLIDENTVNLKFDTATAGSAELFVREVSSTINEPAQVVAGEVFSPVSTNLVTGTITIALTTSILNELTVASGDNIAAVRIKFTDSNKQIQFGRFTVDPTNSNTPWSSVSKVVFRNKSFNVATINIFTSGYNPALISNGTTAEILKLDNTPFSKNQAIALLAQAPFDRADIITNELVELDRINSSSNLLFFDNDSLVCNNNAKTSIFPNLLLA